MEKGFTTDGYILDQDCFEDYIYRGISSAINGCGWIAAYDFLRGLGKTVDFWQVHREMNAFFPQQIPGPTPVRVLRQYLRRWGRYPFRWGGGTVSRPRKKAGRASCATGRGRNLILWPISGRRRAISSGSSMSATGRRKSFFPWKSSSVPTVSGGWCGSLRTDDIVVRFMGL